ncbi:MAG TPA: type II secretion system protein [Alphaproteobacteria bacterium]|nr:type II secretion system protein [Alphaproteobacteria bacterium]
MQLRNQKGFTLIEIAIVLTIVGLVIGGIWLAASTVLNNNKKSELSRQVVQIVQNTKNLFANQTGASPATGFTTDTARNAGVFPAGMVVGNFVRHPFATVLTANSVTLNANAGNQLTLLLGTAANPLPRDACIELVTRVATQENFSRYGIFSVNGLTAGATVQNLSATCNVADPGNNPVTIIFNVP